MVVTYYDLVFRTAFRVMCDRVDAESVAARVFGSVEYDGIGAVLLQSEEMENMLLRRTVLFCRMKILRRRAAWLFGEQHQVFVQAVPEVANQDDYTVKQAWQLFCRASFKMTPLQRIVYALSELDYFSLERIASILRISSFRVGLALDRAVRTVRNELSLYNCEDKYHSYVSFIRQVH